MPRANDGDLRVWHIPQVPGEQFFVDVASPEEGKKVLGILSEYDAFQYRNHIKPDYSSAQGLEMFLYDEWCDWMNEDGFDIDELELVDGKLVLVDDDPTDYIPSGD